MEKKVLLVIALLSCVWLCQARRDRERTPIEPMSLGFFRRSGLYDAWSNKTMFIDKFLAASSGPTNKHIPTDVTGSKLKPLGRNPISKIERSELETGLDHAACGLYDQVVEIPNDKAHVLLYPSCVLLKQCGGCTGHPALACKSTASKPKTIEVVKYVYNGRSAVPDESAEIMQLEEHTACEPQCKITAEDCNLDLHKFDNWDCKCICKRSRTNCPSGKRWNEDACACSCANVQKCGSGFKYDMATCSCKQDTERSGGNFGGVLPQVATPSVEQDFCKNFRCPRRYIAKMNKQGGTCACEFDKDYKSKNRGRG